MPDDPHSDGPVNNFKLVQKTWQESQASGVRAASHTDTQMPKVIWARLQSLSICSGSALLRCGQGVFAGIVWENDDNAWDVFMERVQAWEKMSRTNHRVHSRSLHGGSAASAGRAQRPVVTPIVAVNAFARDSLEDRRLLGYAWPLKLHVDVKGGQSPTNKLKTHLISGQTVRGALMDESHGTRSGRFAMWSVAHTGGEKVGELSNSKAQGAGGMYDVWNTVQTPHHIIVSTATQQ